MVLRQSEKRLLRYDYSTSGLQFPGYSYNREEMTVNKLFA